MEENQEVTFTTQKDAKNKMVWHPAIKYLLIIIVTVVITLWCSGVTFEELYTRYLIHNYYDGQYNPETAAEGKVAGIISGLEDPNSYYISKEIGYKLFNEAVTHVYGGIGVEIFNDKEKGCVIVKVFDDTPASRAGVHAKDIITAVDGKSAEEIGFEKISECIKGEAGTEVTLTVTRGSEIKEFTLKREQVNAPTVYPKMLNNNIGYLEITQFDADTHTELENAIDGLKSAESLIIDLRNNPGGIMDIALRMMDLFLEEKTMVIANFNGTEKVYKADKDVKYNQPMVVLINERSASSSEIFAAGMKDNDRGYVIGEKSYGKGSIQRTYKLPENAGLNLTVGHFYSPNNNKIDGIGVTPNMMIEASEEGDVQLEAAIKYLAELK